MTKDQLALRISLAIHKHSELRKDSFKSYINTYKCLCTYLEELSLEDIAGIASRYGVTF